MKTKFENLFYEPHTKHISSYFKNDSKELSSLVLLNKRFHTLFQPKRLLDSLLHHVAWGNQTVAEKMLQTDPELMLQKGVIIDPSGRYFKNISPFEFVLWALDVRYMTTMMLDCLHGASGLKTAQALKEQYENFNMQGVTYTLNEQTITEKHYNFSNLINSLQTYIDNYDTWSEPKINKYWRINIGGAQSTLPAHVIQHYCDRDIMFHPTPIFTTKQFNRSLNIPDWDVKRKMSWINTPNSDLVLGRDFAIAAGSLKGHGWERAPKPAWISTDLTAINALCRVRTTDFILLQSQLEYLCKNQQEPKKSNECVIF